MSKYPAMPVFVDTWLANTHPDLSLEEQGCYWILICAAWLRPHCDLPADDAWIAKRLGIDLRTWKRLRPRVLLRFWTLSQGEDGSRWTQKKQRDVRKVVEKSSIANAANARSRWEKSDTKSTRNKDLGDTDAHANGNAMGMPPILSNLKNTNLEKQNTAPTPSAGRPLEARPSSGLAGQYYFSKDVDAPRSPPPPEPPKPKGVHLRAGSEQYEAWVKHTGKRMLDARGGYTYETEWPPVKVLTPAISPNDEDEEIPF